MAHRVVVTGLGAVTPLGNSVAETWQALVEGRSGVGPITKFDASSYPARIAGEIRGFDIRQYVDGREARKMDPFAHYAVAAGIQAMSDAGLRDGGRDPERTGVVLGIGIGGFETLETAYEALLLRGPERVPPMTIPKHIANEGPGNVAIVLDCQGPCFTVTTACASGTDAISCAAGLVEQGVCDVVVSGGVEACITKLAIMGFCVIQALTTEFNDRPTEASRPFDRRRSGFVMGEGAGVLVLERLDHALERGARIYAEVAGSGMTCDAQHLTAPHLLLRRVQGEAVNCTLTGWACAYPVSNLWRKGGKFHGKSYRNRRKKPFAGKTHEVAFSKAACRLFRHERCLL